MREIILLECEACGNRWYSTTKNRKTHTDKFSIKKYCKFCRKHTLHKEKKP
ncbi:MAG: 50S ribosomal protein L33 [Candidatus Hydrogenedentota bacterium]|nr:MAG: 50S ribosomal protein L33 [Candidatus Hydrogenedentota bacterium]